MEKKSIIKRFTEKAVEILQSAITISILMGIVAIVIVLGCGILKLLGLAFGFNI